MKDLHKLTPFKYFALTNFPYIEADFDALTNYELFCKIAEYINNIASVQNDVTDNFNELLDDFNTFTDNITDEWNETKTYIDNYFDNLDVQQEINNKLDEMAENGYFTELFNTLFRSDVLNTSAQVTSNWIAENLMQETGYVIDDSLTVANAGADAKVTGDLIREVNKESDGLYLEYIDSPPSNLIDLSKIITGYYINASGVPTTSASWDCTDFIDISEFTKLSGYNLGLGAYYDANKDFLSSITLGNTQDSAIPNNAKFIRCSILPANLQTARLSYKGFIIENKHIELYNSWKSPIKNYYGGRTLASSHLTFTVPVNNTEATSGTATNVNYEGVADYVDVECILTLPYEYDPVGIPCKLVMFCHGAGRGVTGADNWTTIEGYQHLIETFTSRGYAVFDCNGFNNTQLGESFWGKEMGVEAWRKAYRYVTTHYNVQKDFSIYAFSMGGLTAMNMVFQGFPNINAVAMGSPVLNLEEVFNSTDGTKSVLQTLYGLGDTWDDSKVIGQNPWKHIINNNNVLTCPYKLPPIKIWYGGNETGTGGNPAVNKYIAEDFVTAIQNNGGYAYYREVANSNHDICYGANNIVNTEIMTFIERFEKVFPNVRDANY